MAKMRKALSQKKKDKSSKILRLLHKKPMTALEITQAFRDCRFDNYSFWARCQISDALCSLVRQGLVEQIGKAEKGKAVYGLVQTVGKEKDSAS